MYSLRVGGRPLKQHDGGSGAQCTLLENGGRFAEGSSANSRVPGRGSVRLAGSEEWDIRRSGRESCSPAQCTPSRRPRRRRRGVCRESARRPARVGTARFAPPTRKTRLHSRPGRQERVGLQLRDAAHARRPPARRRPDLDAVPGGRRTGALRDRPSVPELEGCAALAAAPDLPP